MKRVIFVGVHNKPGFFPLDSKSKSGKLIDRIIKELPDYHCIKTNLYDIEYFPTQTTEALDRGWIQNWYERVDKRESDIVITLGDCVNKVFKRSQISYRSLGHPSAVWANDKKEEYVKHAVTAIREKDKWQNKN